MRQGVHQVPPATGPGERMATRAGLETEPVRPNLQGQLCHVYLRHYGTSTHEHTRGNPQV